MRGWKQIQQVWNSQISCTKLFQNFGNLIHRRSTEREREREDIKIVQSQTLTKSENQTGIRSVNLRKLRDGEEGIMQRGGDKGEYFVGRTERNSVCCYILTRRRAKEEDDEQRRATPLVLLIFLVRSSITASLYF